MDRIWTTKPPMGWPLDAGHPLTGGLAAFWPLWERGGNTATDVVGGVELALHGATFAGGGLSFSSANSAWAGAAAPASLQLPGPLTLAIGWRPTGAPSSGFATIAGVTYDSAFDSPYYGYGLQYASGTASIEGFFDLGGSLVSTSPFPAVSPGNYYTDVLTVASGSQSLYQQGALVATASYSGSATYGSGPQVWLSGSNALSRYINAVIDWVAIWSRALTQRQAAALTPGPWHLFLPDRRRLAPVTTVVFTATASGGAVLGGAALPSAAWTPSASGGAVLGGAATASAAFTAPAAGGVVTGGSAAPSGLAFTVVASGGAVLGGPAIPSAAFTAPAAGGAVLGGSATPAGLTFTASASGGAVLGGTSIVTASPSGVQSFREALTAKLGSIPELVAIVGDAIYPGALPQTHDLWRDGPAVCYAIPSNPRGHVLAGSDGTSAARVKIEAWSGLYGEVDAITTALWDAIDGVPDAWGDGTCTILSVSQQDEQDAHVSPRAGSDKWMYRIISDYRVGYRTGFPTLS